MLTEHANSAFPAGHEPKNIQSVDAAAQPAAASSISRPASSRRAGWITLLLCGVLLGQFFILAMLAARTKNATYDEHFHVLGAWSNLWLHDYRVDPDNFTLWGYWAALPLGRNGIRINPTYPLWNALLNDSSMVRPTWAAKTLYHTAGNDVDAILFRARFMMLLVGLALGALVAWWAFRLAGPIAAVSAAALFAFDPNFLGHSPLVKNDVAMALVYVAAALIIWRVGRRATWLNLAALALVCGLAANIKVTGLLLGPIAMVLLGFRAVMPLPWQFLGHALNSPMQRFSRILLIGCACFVSIFAITWASYGFRFDATPDPSRGISMSSMIEFDQLTRHEAAMLQGLPAAATVADQPIGLVPAIAQLAEQYKLLPQAWLCGIAYQDAELQCRPMYLCGQSSLRGWWYYFPVASLFKLPTATLAAIGVVPVILLWKRRRVRRRAGTAEARLAAASQKWDLAWSVIAIAGAAAIYLLIAMIGRVNLGVRHIFPVYALLFIGLGCGAAAASRLMPRALALAIAAILVSGLAAESWAAFPDYIAFFNTPVGGSRGGVKLLGDANLDWGQDIKNLGNWSRQHPDEKIYIFLSGLGDPGYYGVKYTTLLQNIDAKSVGLVTPDRPSVLAIDANAIQGTFIERDVRAALQPVISQPPRQVLGGTMYLFDIGPDSFKTPE